MSWNHRVIYHETEHGNWFGIHEVYYDVDRRLNGYTKEPISVVWDEDEDLESAKWTLDKMKECLDKPILYGGDKFPEVYNV